VLAFALWLINAIFISLAWTLPKSKSSAWAIPADCYQDRDCSWRASASYAHGYDFTEV
jgi:protein-disulfide isomerase